METDFFSIMPSDRAKLAPYLQNFSFIDTGFASLFYSAQSFDIRCGFVEGSLCIRMTYEGEGVIYATSDMDNLDNIVNLLYPQQKTGVLKFDFVEKAWLERFAALSGFECEASFNDAYSDYFSAYTPYADIDKSVSLHKYKDYNQFCKRYAHEVFELCPERLPMAKALLDEWCAGRDCAACSDCEKKWILRLFDAWEELAVKGLLVYVDGVPAGFNVAEKNGDIMLKLIGKSIGKQVGLHVFMSVESARRLFPDAKYVNMGPDSGVDGLRRFKEKFKPYTKLEKYLVKLRAK